MKFGNGLCGYRGYTRKDKEAIEYNFIQLKIYCTLEKLVKLKLIGAKFGEIAFLHRYDQKRKDVVVASRFEKGGGQMGVNGYRKCFH